MQNKNNTNKRYAHLYGIQGKLNHFSLYENNSNEKQNKKLLKTVKLLFRNRICKLCIVTIAVLNTNIKMRQNWKHYLFRMGCCLTNYNMSISLKQL